MNVNCFFSSVRNLLKYTMPYLGPNSFHINPIYYKIKDTLMLPKLDMSGECVVIQNDDGES